MERVTLDLGHAGSKGGVSWPTYNRFFSFLSFPLLGTPALWWRFHSSQCRNCVEDNRLVSNLVFLKAWQNRNKSVFKS